MRALVVIPTYNEAVTLPRVVRRILEAADGSEHDVQILVVDDASPDGTGDLADELAAHQPGVHVLHRCAKGGLGSAYRAGFAWALQRGFQVCCEMDADESHDAADLPRLLWALNGADLVIGSRYVPGGRVRDWPWYRRALSRGGNRYAKSVTGLPVADATSGYRTFRVEVLQALALATVHSDGYSFQLEMALRTWRLGFRIVEVPITFVERTAGASKISRAIVFEALWRVLQWGVQGPRRAQPVHPASVVLVDHHEDRRRVSAEPRSGQLHRRPGLAR
ncbi:MAG: polyprenol monophosphomannose synthase [Actinomycetota bacterium]|nr:polyprenol monophosphomannose synthase [Actinomycetota bacterium]